MQSAKKRAPAAKAKKAPKARAKSAQQEPMRVSAELSAELRRRREEEGDEGGVPIEEVIEEARGIRRGELVAKVELDGRPH